MRNDHRPRRGAWHSRRLQLGAAAGAVVVAAVAAAVVHAEAPTARQTTGARATVVKVRATKVGKILVDANGRTLYMFARDRKGKSSCYGSCATFWPPELVKGKPRAAGGARAKLLATTRRKDGRRQVTYRRHPLYRFKLDTRAGQVNGQALNESGGRWYVLSPGGVVIKKKVATAATKTPAPPATTTTSGGGGAAWG
jgi:predicted lipoprotein with Yx(FWY)xxD motif